MKAYKVWDEKGDGSTIIYAETAKEARQYAYSFSDAVEYAEYIDIRAKRMPLCDPLYNGKSREGDWYDMDLRKILVEEYGWYCLEPLPNECRECRLCDEWEEL